MSDAERTQKDCIEPIPYPPAEFARKAGLSLKTVLQMISDGRLKTISVEGYPRIPISEIQRQFEEWFSIEKMIRTELAFGVRAGWFREVVDSRGEVFLQRTEVPIDRSPPSFSTH